MSEKLTCNSCGNVHLIDVQGERGPKGDKGDKGDRGLQGERGFRGDRGISGDGIKVLGVIENERELPDEESGSVIGDAYIIKPDGSDQGDLYVYSRSRAGVERWVNAGTFKGDTGRGFKFKWNQSQLGVKVDGDDEYTYTDLKGDQGPKGDKGDKGDQGIQGLNAILNDNLSIDSSEGYYVEFENGLVACFLYDNEDNIQITTEGSINSIPFPNGIKFDQILSCGGVIGSANGSARNLLYEGNQLVYGGHSGWTVYLDVDEEDSSRFNRKHFWAFGYIEGGL